MLPVFDQSFWNSVWSSVFASTLFTFVLTVFVLWAVNKFRKPKLSVFIDIGHRVTREKVLHVSIANTGQKEVKEKELRWHLYMGKNFKPLKMRNTSIFLNNISTYEVTGINNSSIHPDSSLLLEDIVVDCSGFKEEPKELEFYIAISTPSGQWTPREKWFIKPQAIEYDTGHIIRKIYKVTNVTS